ncbi:uncharacterized protein A1O9_00318 [Exophiala aquamarina CBS 119918]|uniref:3'-5' exonuclease domain-containing protein n=1 Tax=Exophiala aquamarina CBS 119918 TaxID=1182545 RepID=A0A072PR60_9EURO|nr:uncharacterized protein A1O9_00318 [Exophiala aquamarina CBS 119918]KEF62346.1 hypothetical protein A1O9_00318 [Exophiala aquamarina CBS 119918]
MHILFRTCPELCLHQTLRFIEGGRKIASLSPGTRHRSLPAPRDGKTLTGFGCPAGAAYQNRCPQTSSAPKGLSSRVNPSQSLAATNANSTAKPSRLASIPENVFLEPQSPATIVLVDTEKALKDMLLKIQGLPVKPPSLYIDAEGHNLGRTGSLALLQILVTPLNSIFVVDIHVLKDAAFTLCTDESTMTLRKILESDEIPKVIFDARNDSDNLFTEYGICLGGVRDLQLMEFFSRRDAPGFTVLGLAKCVERHLFASPDVIQKWKLQKERGKLLFNPRFGGSPDVFTKRPLSNTMLAYASGDVEHMSALYHKYRRRLPLRRWKWVLEKSRKRVLTSHAPAFALEHDRRWVAPSWTGNWDHDAKEPVSNSDKGNAEPISPSPLPGTSLTKTPQNDASVVLTTANSTVETPPRISQPLSTIKGPSRQAVASRSQRLIRRIFDM